MFQKVIRISNPELLAEIRKKPCAVTGLFGYGNNKVVVHHMITVGSRGHDLPWNLLPILLDLHTRIHKLGYTLMADRYPLFKRWLLENGWEYDDNRKKWRHYG